MGKARRNVLPVDTAPGDAAVAMPPSPARPVTPPYTGWVAPRAGRARAARVTRRAARWARGMDRARLWYNCSCQPAPGHCEVLFQGYMVIDVQSMGERSCRVREYACDRYR